MSELPGTGHNVRTCRRQAQETATTRPTAPPSATTLVLEALDCKL